MLTKHSLIFKFKFSSLQELSLIQVYLRDVPALQNLICSCPLIENLTLSHLEELKFVSIHGLPKPNRAKIFQVVEVDIDAPSLDYLHVGADDGSVLDAEEVYPCKINMDKCSSLRELTFDCVNTIFVTNQWLLELFCKFPLIERIHSS